MSERHDFVANAFALRVHAGADALSALPQELRRAGVTRPLLLCGPTLRASSGLPERIAGLLDGAALAIHDGLRKEAPLSCVEAAVAVARAHRADGLVAVGAGSVLKAARVVAILLAEGRPAAELATRYPESGPAVSPKLPAPKLPIFNVPTAPTTAQARAGSAIAVDGGRQRLEFYDPKTRPRALFWDAPALMSAPANLVATTGAAVHWRALMSIAVVDAANPLVAASRHGAWRLAADAMAALRDPDAGAGPRIDLCSAALLQIRDEDDGGAPMRAHGVARAVYALGAAVFTAFPSVAQAAAYACLTGAAVRVLGGGEPAAVAGLARALGIPVGEPSAVAEALDGVYASLGLPTRLRALGIEAGDLPGLRELATRNFNADRNREFLAHAGRLDAILALAR